MDLRSWLSALGVAPAGGTAYGMAAPPVQSPQPMGLAVPPMARGTKLSAEMSYDGSHPRKQEQAARDHFRSYGPDMLMDALIPGYGAGGDAKAASEAYGEGRYGAAAGNALMAAMDFVPVLGALAAIPGAARKAMTVKAYRGGNDGNWFSSSQEVARRYAADRGVDRVQEQSLTFENPLVIDGNGSNWVSIGGAPLYEVFDAAGKFKGYRTKSAGLSDMGEGAYFGAKSGMYEGGRTTEEIVKEARQKGHDGVVFKNIADNPDGGVDRGLSDTIVAIPENAQNSTAAAKGIRAFHGSPHDFDRFDISKIGTGEGAQAYGHGLYFAENEGVARAYRDNLSEAPDIVRMKGGDIAAASQAVKDNISKYLERIQELQALPETAQTRARIREWQARLEADQKTLERLGDPNVLGRMYEVNINADPEAFLDWDKPLSADHPLRQSIRDQARRIVETTEGGGIRNDAKNAFLYAGKEEMTGAGAHGSLVALAGGSKAAGAAALREAGIPGIKYLDAGSRGAGDGSRNYVVFDDRLITILRKYGIGGLIAGGGAYALTDAEYAQAAELLAQDGMNTGAQ